MKSVSAVIFAIALWLPLSASSAKTLKAAFGQEKAPYLWVEKEQVKGIEFEIVRAALAAEGNGVTPVVLPNRRANQVLSSGDFDLVTGVLAGEAGEAFYSDEYFTYANCAISRKSRHVTLKDLSDLFHYRVVAFQTAWENLGLAKLHPSGPADLDYTELPSQDRQTKFFWADRADVNLIDRYVFEWYSRKMAKEVDTSDAVTYHDILPKLSPRAAFRTAKDRDAFNAGLKEIRENGTYDRIFADYGIHF